jgi:hypothetical protein
MKINFTNEEALEIFHNSLCNAYGTGYMQGYGIEINFDEADYKEAKKSLILKKPNQSPCYEDVLVEILRIGKTLTMVDNESGEDDSVITEEDVVSRMAQVPLHNLLNILKENDDAIDADCVIQTIFYKDIIFG